MQYETLLKSQLDWKCEEEENSYPHIKGIESKQRSDGASGKTCKMDCMWNTWNACPPALVDFFILPMMSWISSPPRGESYLWRIDGSPPSYLYGTIHLPFDLIWPSAPKNTREAFQVKFSLVYLQYEVLKCKKIISEIQHNLHRIANAKKPD